MKLDRKKLLDYYLGGALLLLLRPLVWLAGRALRRDHSPTPRGEICLIKMLGGGSLVIAYPALLGLRRRYPGVTLSLLTTGAVKPFADSLGVFDRTYVVEDSTLPAMALSSLRCLLRLYGADTVVDLEVYSRLTTVMATLSCARNRVGFYLESAFWRRDLHTHLVFFNRYSGSHYFYEAICRRLGAEPAPIEDCRKELLARLGGRSRVPGRSVAVGPGCSEFGKERLPSAGFWRETFVSRVAPGEEVVAFFLGSRDDRPAAEAILSSLAGELRGLRAENLCGSFDLAGSLRRLASCGEYWGVDSALLHYARLLGLRCVSFWGPTDPATRLKPFPGLEEEIFYRKLPCSPCIHVAETPPCAGNNFCIRNLYRKEGAEGPFLSWSVEGGGGPAEGQL